MGERNKWVALLLAVLLGSIGVHKFYLGRKTAGVLYLVFCWTAVPFLLSIVDSLVLLFQGERTFDAKYNESEGAESRRDGATKLRCVQCREMIWADALKCRYCGSDAPASLPG